MSILNIGTRALMANQLALQTAGNNVANVNTPGYKAKRPELSNVLGLSDNPYETKLAQRMGSSQLSSLLQTPDGAIHVVFTYDRLTIKYVRITEAWIRAGAGASG